MKSAWSKLRCDPRALRNLHGLPVILGVALGAAQHCAQAQDTSKHYYHVQQLTTGCQTPAAVRLLTNPNEMSHTSARHLRSIHRSGHCVTITPRSEWAFLFRENDLAMMSYAGTVGQPGSYYLRVSDLVDANGQHPDEVETDTSPATAGAAGANEAVASAPPADPTAKAGEVPTIIPSTTPPQVAAANPPGKTIEELITNTANTPPSFTEPSGESVPTLLGSSSHIWVPAISLLLFVGALGGFVALRRRQGRSEKFEPALEIALGEVHAQASALRAAKADSSRPDRYGTFYPDGWEREKASFISSRITPRLREAGYDTILPALLPAIDGEIERHANSLIDPPVATAGSPSPVAREDAEAIDTDLSLYASRCTSLLKSAGWTTDPSPAAYSMAVDIFAERGGRKLLLQCNGGSAPVGVEVVQQVYTLKDRRRADIAAIVTHAPFTRAAQQMASANGVHALHDDELMELIR
jgi:restriction system protein